MSTQRRAFHEGPLPMGLETDDPIGLCDQLRSVHRRGELGVLACQVILSNPATAGTEPSDVDRDFGLNHFGH
jgi:hypothetical protein